MYLTSIITRKTVCILLWALCLTGCKFHSVDINLDFAKDNKAELTKVLDYGLLSGDTLKQAGVLFILGNIRSHHSLYSDDMDTFTSKVNQSLWTPTSMFLDSLWKEEDKSTQVTPLFDAETLTSGFLIDDIDNAYTIWKNSTWKRQVPFDVFCKYILPYRFTQEPLETGWRKHLHNKYHGMVDSISNIKDAYAVVYNNLKDSLKGEGYEYPSPLPVSTMEKVMRGNCIQRCIYIGLAMRALGIPVAIDWVKNWANYSTNGHYWVSLVLEDGTYTLSDDGKNVVKYGPIDSSVFKIDFAPEEDYPFQPTFTKRCAKVFRFSYEEQKHEMAEMLRETSFSWLFGKNTLDVSEEYNYKEKVIIPQKGKEDIGCLCTYVTARGWMPTSVVRAKDGIFEFSNLNDSVVYMFATYKDNRMEYKGFPMTITPHGIKYFKPSTEQRQKIDLYRKYPLIGRHISACAAMKGATIEGSNSPDFKTKSVLYRINESPAFRNVYKSQMHKKNRYIRVMPEEGKKFPIAEIELWSNERKLHATTYGNTYSQVEKAVDCNTATVTKNIMSQSERMFMLDLHKGEIVTDIVLYPSNDDNYIVPENTYEFFCWINDRWTSLGKKISNGYFLRYDNMPLDGLFLLHNLTKGHEERIFSIEKGKQIWW